MRSTLQFLFHGVLAISIFLAISCKTQPQTTITEDKAMEPIAYEAAWKKVDSLEQKQHIRSALDEVEKIKAFSKHEDNTPQYVKSLIYENRLKSQLEEDGLAHSIKRIENELDSIQNPAKAVLHSILGQYYAQFLQQRFWVLKNRTDVSGKDSEDILTWGISDLIEAVQNHFITSVQYEETKSILVSDYDQILTSGRNTDHLRPVLFDILLHRALDNFMQGQSFLTEPVYAFNLDDPAAFDPAASFVKLQFESKDRSSFKLLTLNLMQEALAFHLREEKPDALVDVDLKRLRFVYDQITSESRDDLYIKSLENLAARHASHSVAAEIAFYQAQYWYEKGQKFRPGVFEGSRWDLKKAVEICENAMAKYPESYGAKRCQNLKNTILNKQLDIRLEKVNIPGENLLVSLQFRNIPDLHFKILETPSNEYVQQFTGKPEEVIRELNTKSVVKSWRTDLPDPEDYQLHTIEIPIDPRDYGRYIFWVCDDEQFGREKTHAYTTFHVSDLAFWTNQVNGRSSEIVVVDRQNGKPLPNVNIDFYSRGYNARNRQSELSHIGEAHTDVDGKAVMPQGSNRGVVVKLQNDQDILFLEDNFPTYSSSHTPRRHQTTSFFLDRAIYRPGQTVYFKGYLMEFDTERIPHNLKNKSVEVKLFDVNQQEKGRMELVSNGYGTVEGSFILPTSGITGRMHLWASTGNSRQHFNVEEYKRPKFEVISDPVTTNYTLGDEVTVTGLGKAYAGAVIDNALVQYRVTRKAFYPYWPWWRGDRWFPSGTSREIAHGTTRTDQEGKYEIQFTAHPDLAIAKEDKPNFIYEVSVDITDAAGETRSTAQSITLGYQGFRVQIPVGQTIKLQELNKLPVLVENLNGKPLEVSASVQLTKLESPDTHFRSRYWTLPDLEWLDRESFRNLFPQYAPAAENSPASWAKTNQNYRTNQIVNGQDTLDLSETGLSPGTYSMEVECTHQDGETVSNTYYFTAYDSESASLPPNMLFVLEKNHSSVEPGNTVSFPIISNRPLNLYRIIDKGKPGMEESWLLANGLLTISSAVSESDRGDFYIHTAFAFDNRFYSNTRRITVPWSNKDLDIQFLTFRDKVLPGAGEEWQIRIKGPDAAPVAAEFLGAMYDASLDAFAEHNWSWNIFPRHFSTYRARPAGFQANGLHFFSHHWRLQYADIPVRQYRNLKVQHVGMIRAYSRKDRMRGVDEAMPGAPMEIESADDVQFEQANAMPASGAEPPETTGQEIAENQAKAPLPAKPVRTDLNETVFFFPRLTTDAEGNILIKFKMRESLTRWNFFGLAHTKDLAYAFTEKSLVTQKDLMVFPNPPRFFRQGDEILFSAKVANISELPLKGDVRLEILDAFADVILNSEFNVQNEAMPFEVSPGASSGVSWRLNIPSDRVMPVRYRIIAEAGNFADGEEAIIPVMSNRMLVTESLPLPVKGNQDETFTFQSLKENISTTLQHHKYSVEFTSNPAWYAVQALPYLREYPHECSEQVFNRLYANLLSRHVIEELPQIQAVFEHWKTDPDSESLLSQLSKNKELKTALLEETPWVLDALDEETQKKNIALLFDLNTISQQTEQSLALLKQLQLSNGGFPWFAGGRDNWYITQYLVEGFGHLEKLGAFSAQGNTEVTAMLNSAVSYIDNRLMEHYEKLKALVEAGKTTWEEDHLHQIVIHYLYARSFFKTIPLTGELGSIRAYYLGQASKYWPGKPLYQQALITLGLHRLKAGDKAIGELVQSFTERALVHDELGRYWKENPGWFWYELPVERHALMIELYGEITQDQSFIDDLRIWLLKNKQTNRWKTTKATAAAVYALLVHQDDWLTGDLARINVGGENLQPELSEIEAGSGYFKTQWPAESINNRLSEIKVENPNNHVAWGAAYWQYFEDLDKIRHFEETPLQIRKELYKVRNTDTGPALSSIDAQSALSPGDQIKVRIEIRVDRAMEYVHLKDMRASGLEPINVLSRYKWQGGLGYYESTGDLATNFFIEYLPRGTWVFEYPLRVVHAGIFSNGITTMQCMYAPEFTTHSEGIILKIAGPEQ